MAKSQSSLKGFLKPAPTQLGKRPSSPIDLDNDEIPPRSKKIKRLNKREEEESQSLLHASDSTGVPPCTLDHNGSPIGDFELPLSFAKSMVLSAPGFELTFCDATINPGKQITKEKLDLLYFKSFLTGPGRKHFYDWLLAELPWYRVKYTVRGININTPRFTTVFGIDAKPKSLNQYKQRPRPIPPLLVRFKEEVERRIGAEFNIVLCNFYQDMRDSISFHQDSESFLGPNPTIASLSLGTTREFQMRPVVEKGEKSPIDKYPLESGDMIIMRGPTQANWLHAIPKRATSAGGRINITLRKAMHPGGTENYLRYNIGDGVMYRYIDGKMQEQAG